MKTMRFYVLDSLVDHLTYERLQKKEGELKGAEEAKRGKGTLSRKQKEELRGKERLASQCRDCIFDIIRRVKPEILTEPTKIPKEISWAKVHMQCDTDSCGVHVLSWLQGWDGSARDNWGYTMPKLSHDEIRKTKVDCLWWLVTHERNKHAHKVLTIVASNQQSKRKKET